MPKLKNQRHELFSKEYLKDLNATRSYRAVYKCSVKVAEASGCRLLGNVKVQQRISELVDKRAKKLEVTAESLLDDLVKIKDKCIDEDKDKEAIAAIKLIGKHKKLGGIWTDRVAHEGEVRMTIEDLVEAGE